MIVPANQYYVSRDAENCEQYWDEAEDPDGVVRQRLNREEEQRYLADVADELAFVSDLQAQSIVDVGCGPGWFLSALSAPVRVGTEICPRAVQEAVKRGLLVSASLGPFDDDAFDVVRCHHVIEHLPKPERELTEMRRVCGQWLLISTPDFGSPCAAHFGDNYRMLHDKTHCSLFTNESMHRFLRDAGFTIERVTYPFPLRYAVPGWVHRWRNTETMSPPAPGNWMTFYCRKT